MNSYLPDIRTRLEAGFRDHFGAEPEAAVRAPGRVNLIGEHTDYNQGFVLPAAIDRYLNYAGRRRPDRVLRAHALDLDEFTEFSLDGTDAVRDDPRLWCRLLAGVAQLLDREFGPLPGINLVFSGNVPLEAGLSSSAAVEMGAVALWQALLGLELDPVAMVKLGQRVENEFLGVPTGIMDQFISAMGRHGHALLLDCRDLTFRYVPIPPDVDIVVANTGVKRALARSEYGARVAQCHAAVDEMRRAGLHAESLRDVTLDQFLLVESGMSELPRRRARHVISENERVGRAVAALDSGDVERFGVLMNASHVSLRDDYEVSSHELDVLTEIAWKCPGVLGARMTGAGFGGCTVNLVRRPSTESLVASICKEYAAILGRVPEVYVLRTADGAFTR